MSEYDEYTVLDAVHDVLETERSFYQTVRFLDGHTRNHIVAAHMRNTTMTLDILRRFMTQPQRTTMVMNIPLSVDVSGNPIANFFDPIPVVPTREQITAGTEQHINVAAGTVCAICQDAVACATRLRHCGHSFHGSCIDQWLQMNPRCPVCRHDIREQRLLRHAATNTNEDRSVHADEE